MLTLLSVQQVNRLANEAYQATLQAGRQKQLLNQDSQLVQRLRGIADRLIAQVAVFRADAKAWPWAVNVLTDTQLNAYCLPGGKILFYTGIIQQLHLTDAEIAAIMGHEMAHALREHGREALSRAYVMQLGSRLLTVSGVVNVQSVQFAHGIVNYALTLPHSRNQEAEADSIGLELMARAGYTPQAAVSLWRKMSSTANGGKQTPEFMSTHPAYKTRIANLETLLPKVEPLYRQAVDATSATGA